MRQNLPLQVPIAISSVPFPRSPWDSSRLELPSTAATSPPHLVFKTLCEQDPGISCNALKKSVLKAPASSSVWARPGEDFPVQSLPPAPLLPELLCIPRSWAEPPPAPKVFCSISNAQQHLPLCASSTGRPAAPSTVPHKCGLAFPLPLETGRCLQATCCPSIPHLHSPSPAPLGGRKCQ